MSQTLTLATEGAVYTDFENTFASSNWCTPSMLGFSICANVSASGGLVTLTLTLNSPFGSYTKSFNFNSNICFSWQLPIKLGPSIKVCVANFSTSPNIQFNLTLGLCITLPIIGSKCATWSHTFILPFMAQNGLKAVSLSDDDMSSLLLALAHGAGDESKQACNCH